ncbi:MAG: DtxR family transcriptional regulator [Kiritimatiellia bacterium]
MTADDGALSASLENYLETILLLIQEHAVARSRDIAERLSVKRSSVTGALQALSARGMVNYEPYGYVTLTPSGEALARRVLRRHEALRDFFVKVLAVDSAEADEAACRMEHGVSKHIVDRLLEFADFLETCPRAGVKWVRGFAYKCGRAPNVGEECERCITACLDDVKKQITGSEAQNVTVKLSELKPGEKGLIEKIAGGGAVKRRLADMGVTKRTLVEVVRLAPLGDPLDVKIKGYHLSLRRDEAADIYVNKMEG